MKLLANCKADVQLKKMVTFKAVILFVRILTCFITHNIWKYNIQHCTKIHKNQNYVN